MAQTRTASQAAWLGLLAAIDHEVDEKFGYTQMKYFDVKWLHEDGRYPVRLISEIDRQGYETRKLECFLDGRIGFACESRNSRGVELGTVPMPPLEEINSSCEFDGVEISKMNFEVMWSMMVGE